METIKAINRNKQLLKTLLFILLMLLVPVQGQAIEVGIYGNIWEVKEKDPVEIIKNEIEKKKSELEKKLQNLSKKALEFYLDKVGVNLPPVEKYHKFFVDTTYSLPEDVYIYDKDGNMYVYPAGTTFNPLNFVATFNTYVVINPYREEEVEFLKSYLKQCSNCKVLLTRFPDNENISQIGAPFHIINKDLVDIFHIKGTVAIIKPTHKGLVVEEIPIRPKKDNKSEKN